MECNKLVSPMAVSVLAYSFFSGSLLLLNKMVLRRIPNAPAVTVIQLIACVVAISFSHLLGILRLEHLNGSTIKAFSMYSLLFAFGVYTNMRALQVSNVDTVIVFRACVPLVVATADYVWLGRELPSRQSFGAMLVVGLGAVGYVSIDSAFALNGITAYGWVSLYFVAIAAEMVVGKVITSSVQVQLGMQVLLTNAMSLPLMMSIGIVTGELSKFRLDTLNSTNIPLLVVSCIVGAAIGFSGWWCRSLVSATSFTVIGILNKLLTVLLNILVWDNHASTAGTLCLLGCLAGGAMYRQAPLRSALARSEEPLSPGTAPPPLAPKQENEAVIEVQELEGSPAGDKAEAQLTERTRAAAVVVVVKQDAADDPKKV